MRVGYSVLAQNYGDWDRFEAHERREDVPTRPSFPDGRVLAEEFALVSEIEELGFDSLWTVEHHFTPYTMVPNPLQFLTYFAGRTQRIDLGTMVIVLPWHNPVRVAEDASFLQHALGPERNLFLGLGRGLGRREFGGIGVDMNESRDRFRESVEILKLALGQDRFSYEGKHYRVPETSLRPLPADGRLLENAHCAWGTPLSVPIAAELGLKPLVIPQRSWAEYAGEMETFAQIRAAGGWGPAKPILAVYAYCAETERQAEDAAARYMREYAQSGMRHYEMSSNHFAGVKGYEFYAKGAELGAIGEEYFYRAFFDNHVWGTPEQCIAKAEAILTAIQPRPSQLVFILKYGSMPFEEARRSMRLFAKEVLPAVHAMPS
jgi:alkanesulfonate monooxygenase SsuD/methylene tetrahydromethanopterin reductase-like flavin-dependent oxidoreductase (luciferase family)